MHPVLAEFEVLGVPFVLRSYGTFIALAAVVSVGLAVAAARGLGVPWQRSLLGYAAAVGLGLIGARALDVALNWSTYTADPASIVAVGFRGLALYGGFGAAVVVMLMAARRWGVSGWALADSAVPAVVAGIVLLRIGCFLNGCCAGEATSLPWGVDFPFGTEAWGQAVLGGAAGAAGILGGSSPALHPTQLYDAGAALVCGGAAMLVRRAAGAAGVAGTAAGIGRAARTAGSAWAPGCAALVFASGFLLFRALNQVLRPDAPDATLPGQVLVVLYAAAGVLAGLTLVARSGATRAARTAGAPR